MKFSAYMFIRNGLRAGYTFMEAIENVLPFVDEFYILEGNSDDGTREVLTDLARLHPRIRMESTEPEYVTAPKDKRGLLLGKAFEDALQACRGDWLVQVQADTVFHPITMLAARHFLEQERNALKYGALEIVRLQYRWNWQEMYRRDNLALIFKKETGKVFGDAINVTIKGRICRDLVPLFEIYPAADNAWIFFENLAGKMAGNLEIWEPGGEGIFPWYDQVTGRSFDSDLQNYREKGILPPFWLEKQTPFQAKLPANILPLVGLKKYAIDPRFRECAGLYAPSSADVINMLIEAQESKWGLTGELSEFLKRSIRFLRRIGQ